MGRSRPGLDWYEEPETILDDSNPPFYRWFRGGTLNTCHNALDRHVDGGRGDQTALIYDSPVTGTKRAYTLTDCEMRRRGSPASSRPEHRQGDRVVIYMPMIPEAIVAMLACARSARTRWSSAASLRMNSPCGLTTRGRS